MIWWRNKKEFNNLCDDFLILKTLTIIKLLSFLIKPIFIKQNDRKLLTYARIENYPFFLFIWSYLLRKKFFFALHNCWSYDFLLINELKANLDWASTIKTIIGRQINPSIGATTRTQKLGPYRHIAITTIWHPSTYWKTVQIAVLTVLSSWHNHLNPGIEKKGWTKVE